MDIIRIYTRSQIPTNLESTLALSHENDFKGYQGNCPLSC